MRNIRLFFFFFETKFHGYTNSFNLLISSFPHLYFNSLLVILSWYFFSFFRSILGMVRVFDFSNSMNWFERRGWKSICMYRWHFFFFLRWITLSSYIVDVKNGTLNKLKKKKKRVLKHLLNSLIQTILNSAPTRLTIISKLKT